MWNKPSARICLVFQVLLLASVFSACARSGAAAGSAPDESNRRSTIDRSVVAEEASRASSDELKIPPQSDAQYNFLRGQLALNDENYSQALDYFKEASRLESSPAPTLRKSLAQLYIRLGRVDDALSEVNKALAQVPDDVDLLQLKGGILATRKDIPAAIETYRRVIDLSPAEHEDSYVLIASLYAQDGNVESAKDILRQLISKNSRSFFGHYYLGRMTEAGGDPAAAEQSYKKALEINPDADVVNLDLARVYGAQKRFKEAIEVCERIIKEDPKNTAARNLLAQLLIGDNRVEKALQEFEALGSLEEDPTDTRLKIALIKLQRRDLEGAVTELNLILSQHPENATARYYLASAYAGQKRMNDAVKEIRKLDAKDDYYVESRILGAFMLQQEKRFAEAIPFLNDALEAKPDDIKLLSLRATLEHESGNDAAAVKTAQRLIEIEPDKDRHYFTLGVFLDELGRKDEAIAAMQKAINIEPKNANALNYLGYTLVEQGNRLDEAEELIKRALAVEKDNGYYLDSLGWLYYRQGKYREAAKELERAAKLVSNDSVILEHYALALIKLNNRKKALEVVQQALTHTAESDDKQVGERLQKLLEELKR